MLVHNLGISINFGKCLAIQIGTYSTLINVKYYCNIGSRNGQIERLSNLVSLFPACIGSRNSNSCFYKFEVTTLPRFIAIAVKTIENNYSLELEC